MSWAGLAERWTLFVGAALTVCLGVALVQSSLLLLISAATLDAPAGLSPVEQMRFDAANVVAVTVIAVTLALSAFLAVFIISTTFAFAVAQRRRDLALLRLVGGGRHQVRRLLLGEAVLLGGVGAVTGVPVGLAVMAFQSWSLAALDFVPDGFTGEWRTWALGVSAAVGVGLAVAGVLVAARRAARVQPLEALRDTGEAAEVMTRGRWVSGLLLTAGATALVVLAPLGGPAGGQAMAMCVSVLAALALTALAPLVVPAAAKLLPVRSSGVLARLVRANLRDDVRRSASTAAPLVVLVGLVLGQSGALTSFAVAGQAEQRRTTAADLVLETTGAEGSRAVALDGVATASTEVDVPVALTTGTGETAFTEITRGLVVDPAGYEAVHRGSGSLAALEGRAVAAGPGALGVSPGDTVGVRVGDVDLGRLPVVAAVPAAMGGGASLLLPAGLVPEQVLDSAPSRILIALEDGADAQRVSASLAALGTVSALEAWLERSAERGSETNTAILLVVTGLGGLYAVIGVVNAVVIAGSARRREFAVARATGLRRAQVLRMALAESWVVTAIGLLLGVLAAAGTLAAVAATTATVTGTVTVALPWALVAAVGVGAFVVTGITSALTAWSATRPAPVSLLAARE
ncbi:MULTISPECIES: ABC transporter permease [unclassified Blastococcus]